MNFNLPDINGAVRTSHTQMIISHPPVEMADWKWVTSEEVQSATNSQGWFSERCVVCVCVWGGNAKEISHVFISSRDMMERDLSFPTVHTHPFIRGPASGGGLTNEMISPVWFKNV